MYIPVLGHDECRVWWADIDHYAIEDMVLVLSDAELDRLSRFRRPDDRLRSATANWLLRTTAAAQLGTDPADVPIERKCLRCERPHGKTHIKTNGSPLFASVSHSGRRVGVALSTAGHVGVDVEELTPGEIARSALTQAERDALDRLPAGEREAGFIRLWVRKEAVLKATGHGLQIPPDQVEVTGPAQEPALVNWPLDTPPADVQLRSLNPGPGYTGAVALLTAETTVKVYESSVINTDRSLFITSALTAA